MITSMIVGTLRIILIIIASVSRLRIRCVGDLHYFSPRAALIISTMCSQGVAGAFPKSILGVITLAMSPRLSTLSERRTLSALAS